MKHYKIYTDPVGQTTTVKMGWSWSAFCFSLLWALKKKVWSITTLSTAFLLLSCAFALVTLAVTPELVTKLSSNLLFIYGGYLILGVSFLMGLYGNQWHEETLLKKGARFQTMVTARNKTNAITLYKNKNIDQYLMIA